MSRKVSYEDCLNFIEHKLHIKLYDFQKEIIKCFCEGKEIRTARGVGRTICAEAYGKYISYLLDKNNYETEPDVVIPYHVLVRNGMLDEHRVEEYRKVLSSEAFERDFCSK